MDVKFPEITVPLSGEDGNAFSIIGRTIKAMRQGGVSGEDITVFRAEALSDDYDHVLQTVMKIVETS